MELVIAGGLYHDLSKIVYEYLSEVDLVYMYGTQATSRLLERLNITHPAITPCLRQSLPVEIFTTLPDYAKALFILYQPDWRLKSEYLALAEVDLKHDKIMLLIQLSPTHHGDRAITKYIIPQILRQGYLNLLWLFRDHPGWGALNGISALLYYNESYPVSVEIFDAFISLLSLPDLQYILVNHVATSGGAEKYIPTLIKRDVNPDIPVNGHFALYRAIVQRNRCMVTMLIQYNATIDIVASNKMSPLIQAVGDHGCDIYTTLLEMRADPNFSVNGTTPLQAATSESNYQAVCQLLKYGAR